MKCVIPWMDALLWIQVLCDSIEYVEVLRGNTFSKVTGFHHFRINVIKLDFYKRTVTEFSRNNQFKEILDKVLKDIDSVDWAAKEKDKLGRLEYWLGKKAPNQGQAKDNKGHERPNECLISLLKCLLLICLCHNGFYECRK